MITLALPPILTHNEARDCLGALLRALGEGEKLSMGPIHLNAKALSQFDSSALAVMLELKRQVVERGAELVIDEPSDALLSLVKVYGVADFLIKPSH
jgi:phospholipid transport system transporter-binding protein